MGEVLYYQISASVRALGTTACFLKATSNDAVTMAVMLEELVAERNAISFGAIYMHGGNAYGSRLASMVCGVGPIRRLDSCGYRLHCERELIGLTEKRIRERGVMDG